MSSKPFIKESPEGILLNVRVQPRASRNALIGVHDSALKITLTAAPVNGEANRDLIKFISRKLKCPKSSICLKNGESGRRKTLLITGLNKDDISRKLATFN